MDMTDELIGERLGQNRQRYEDVSEKEYNTMMYVVLTAMKEPEYRQRVDSRLEELSRPSGKGKLGGSHPASFLD